MCHCGYACPISCSQNGAGDKQQEINSRTFFAEMEKKECISPFKEILCGEESIYDYVREGYEVPAQGGR